MGNRVMDQKKMKMKRRGKHRVGHSAFVNGTAPLNHPNYDKKKYSANMAIMSEFHGNPKTIGRDDGWLDRKYPSARMTPHRRLEVLHRLSKLLEDVPQESSIVLVQAKFSSLRLYLRRTNNDSYYFFVEENYRLRFVRKSLTYRTRPLAMAAHDRANIRWKEVVHISESDAPADS